jgi:hypothetical protein
MPLAPEQLPNLSTEIRLVFPVLQSTWRRSGLCARIVMWSILLASSVATLPALAQLNTATVSGLVTDVSGANVPGATVKVTNTDTGIYESVTTDSTGRYAIANLAPGFYNVEVVGTGFGKILRERQELLVGTTSTIDFSLNLSSVTEVVQVSTEAPIVDSSQTALSTVVGTKQLDTLPIINRSFASLAQLSPGVQVTPSSGTAVGSTLQFGDSGSFSNGYVVDGNPIQKFNNGGQIASMAQDWIQEFSVVTQQAPAEYGLSSAGYINAITRSGTNDIHGRAYGYFQNAALNAKPSFLPAKAPDKPDYSQQRLGGMVGGPIYKNKLFYFVGYEWLHNLTSTPVNIPAAFTGPGNESGVFPQTTTDHIAMVKFDYQINQSNSLHVRVNEDYDILENNGIGASGSNVNTVGRGSSSPTDGRIYQATWDYLASSHVLNETRADFYGAYSNVQCNLASILGPYSASSPFGNPTGYYAAITYGGAGVNVGCTSLWGGSGERNLGFEDDVTITHGAHNVKVGVSTGHRNQYNRNTHRLSDGTYSMPGTLAIPFSETNTTTYPIGYTVNWEPNSNLTFDAASPYFGMFVQDSWKINHALTLNAGLRYDYDFTNSGIQTLPELNPINNDATNIAPRVGVAWSPFNDSGRTVFRGGFGIYYDLTHGNVAGTYISSNTGPTVVLNLSATSATLNPYCYNNTACNTSVPVAYQNAVKQVLAYALANYELPNFAPPGGKVTLGTTTYTIPALASLPPNSVYNFDENLKHPASMQVTGGMARQFGERLGISGDFVYTNGYDQYKVYNANINPVNYTAINPNFGSISTFTNAGYFKIYSLQIRGRYSTKRGDSVQTAYTLSYGNDNNPGGGFILTSTQSQASNPFDLSGDVGPANVGRNNFNFSGTGVLPWGLRLSPIITYLSGLPYTATTTSRTVPGCAVYFDHCYPEGYSKNSLNGTSTFTLNARLAKTIKFRERYSATLMFEGYNLSNHVNFTSYQANAQAATFQQPIGAGPRRQLQFAFQFDF